MDSRPCVSLSPRGPQRRAAEALVPVPRLSPGQAPEGLHLPQRRPPLSQPWAEGCGQAVLDSWRQTFSRGDDAVGTAWQTFPPSGNVLLQGNAVSYRFETKHLKPDTFKCWTMFYFQNFLFLSLFVPRKKANVPFWLWFRLKIFKCQHSWRD